MNVEIKKISELRGAEKNVRRHPQRQLEEMIKSYKMFGQYRPLVVSYDGEVLVGNGFFEALKLYGYEEVECIVLPENTTAMQKKKLMLADNKIYGLGADNVTNIDELLSSMGDFDIPGFDENVLSQIYNEVEENVKGIEGVNVSGYISENKIEEIRKIEQKREENPAIDSPDKYVVKEEVVKQKIENEGKAYITCPHCGTKIYNVEYVE